MVERGWVYGSALPYSLVPPIAWGDAFPNDRGGRRALQAWTPLGPVLSAYDKTGATRYLQFAYDFATDWLLSHASEQASPPDAWHRQAVALRTHRLAYVLEAGMNAGLGSGRDEQAMLESLCLHMQVLALGEAVEWRSQEGLYKVAAQLAVARRLPELPAAPTARAHASAHLRKLMTDRFTVEGVLREHSPGRQWSAIEVLAELIRGDLVDDPATEAFCQRAEEALAWFLLPDGRFAMFGDTPARVPVDTSPDQFRSPFLRFALARGAEGTPPPTSCRVFKDAGYFVVRDDSLAAPDHSSLATYLAQTCAFHSRVHKHADDLSLVWYDRGRELLTDAGQYALAGKTQPGSEIWRRGFNYSDPRRIYVESTRAHNTIEIDGRSSPRRRPPYGSGLLQGGMLGGVAYSEANVRVDSISHTRILLFRPAAWLLVFDWLIDTRRRPHRFEQRFHFAPECDAARADGGLEVRIPGLRERLHMLWLLPADELEAVRGQETPELLGWTSRSAWTLTPAWTGGYVVEGCSRHAFATLMHLSTDRPVPSPSECTVYTNAVGAEFGWSTEAGKHRVKFTRARGRRFRIAAEGPF